MLRYLQPTGKQGSNSSQATAAASGGVGSAQGTPGHAPLGYAPASAGRLGGAALSRAPPTSAAAHGSGGAPQTFSPGAYTATRAAPRAPCEPLNPPCSYHATCPLCPLAGLAGVAAGQGSAPTQTSLDKFWPAAMTRGSASAGHAAASGGQGPRGPQSCFACGSKKLRGAIVCGDCMRRTCGNCVRRCEACSGAFCKLCMTDGYVLETPGPCLAPCTVCASLRCPWHFQTAPAPPSLPQVRFRGSGRDLLSLQERA